MALKDVDRRQLTIDSPCCWLSRPSHCWIDVMVWVCTGIVDTFRSLMTNSQYCTAESLSNWKCSSLCNKLVCAVLGQSVCAYAMQRMIYRAIEKRRRLETIRTVKGNT